MKTYWKPIEGFTNYFVSRDGDILSLRSKNPKILSTKPCRDGYVRISLRTEEGVIKSMYVHRLVAIAFILKDNNKPDVNHKDGNKSNNTLSNLEWVTKSENSQHAANNGLLNFKNRPKGEDHQDHKLTEAEVKHIRNVLIPEGYGMREIGRMYDICHKSVTKIRDYITWKHI